MTGRLGRLFAPSTLAVIGGGAWGQAVIEQALAFGFRGEIWPIHPGRKEVAGLRAYDGVPSLPAVPDAAFIGINRDATIGAVERLRRAGAGGAVGFASGFAEADAEDGSGTDAQARLVAAAGAMPVLGPNCYGFVNALDRVCVWPDQHGLAPVDRGVAILTQSSNLAINLSFQNRALPIAMIVACGNGALVSQAEVAEALLEDERITAIGFHIEGFTDVPRWHRMAQLAQRRAVPLVAIKAGRSGEAREAALTHTASVAGEDAGAAALLAALGIGRVSSLPELVEALTLAHVVGPLDAPEVASISCSGGEASLVADLGAARGVRFPALTEAQRKDLRAALGPKVALANPLDYHTYIWREVGAMSAAWTAMACGPAALTLTIVDFPDSARADPADWGCAVEACKAVRRDTGGQVGLVSTLPENLPRDVAADLLAAGIAPLSGLDEAMAAVVALSGADVRDAPPLAQAPGGESRLVEDIAGLADCGLTFPRRVALPDRADLSPLKGLRFPLAVKIGGIAHKTEAGGVRLGLHTAGEVAEALAAMPEGPAHAEEMVAGGVAELLLAVRSDPAHGMLLTLGAGGTLTELWADSVTLLLPATDAEVTEALSRLRIAPLLHGYRQAPAADVAAILQAVRAVQAYVIARPGKVRELEINPLICTPKGAYAADLLLSEIHHDPPD